jgi:putative transposase
MPDYHRNRVPGGIFFFTVNLLDRRSDLLVAQRGVLGGGSAGARQETLSRRQLWTLPEGDDDFPGRWRAIKVAFSKALPDREPRSPAMITRGERGIWQRRYWEHTIRDDRDFSAHVDYIHFNPVKHRLVEHPADWPHSSFHHCVAKGLYPALWVGTDAELQETGERR